MACRLAAAAPRGVIWQAKRRTRCPDARERQYSGLEVIGHVGPAPATPVWTSVGRTPGRSRIAAGRAGTTPIAIRRPYAELVETAFAALGDCALA